LERRAVTFQRTPTLGALMRRGCGVSCRGVALPLRADVWALECGTGHPCEEKDPVVAAPVN
jgi:hypothetical protein